MTFTNTSDRATSIANLEPSLVRYFETINAGEFETTVALFAENGVMYPPFESPIAGKEAIALYLKAEAKGMRLEPSKSDVSLSEDNLNKISVSGKVYTSLFSVNVAWHFLLNPSGQIVEAKINLLASAQELLKLKQ